MIVTRHFRTKASAKSKREVVCNKMSCSFIAEPLLQS